MSGSLIKLQDVTVTSSTPSVTLGGANWDNSYDVYSVIFNNVAGDTSAVYLSARITIGTPSPGTPITSADYYRAGKGLYALTFTNGQQPATNQWRVNGLGQAGTGTQQQHNGLMYLYNFNSTSDFPIITSEISSIISDANVYGEQGGGFCGVNGTARDGLQFFFTSGNITSGSFKLYGLNNK